MDPDSEVPSRVSLPLPLSLGEDPEKREIKVMWSVSIRQGRDDLGYGAEAGFLLRDALRDGYAAASSFSSWIKIGADSIMPL